jgi:hypothetical protein
MKNNVYFLLERRCYVKNAVLNYVEMFLDGEIPDT